MNGGLISTVLDSAQPCKPTCSLLPATMPSGLVKSTLKTCDYFISLCATYSVATLPVNFPPHVPSWFTVLNPTKCSHLVLKDLLQIYSSICTDPSTNSLLENPSISTKSWKKVLTETEYSIRSGRLSSPASPHKLMDQLVHQLILLYTSDCLISHRAPYLNCSSLPSFAASSTSLQLLLFMLCLTNLCNFCCHWWLLCSVSWWGLCCCCGIVILGLLAAALPASDFPCVHMEVQGGPRTEPYHHIYVSAMQM